MKLTEKIFALKEVSPFDRLGYSELAAIAEGAEVRSFAPGEPVVVAGGVLQQLFAVVGGGIESESGPALRRVFGVRSLLFNCPLKEKLVADADAGAVCLLVGKGCFFRIINEFPEFTTGLIEDPEGRGFYESWS